MALNHMSYGLKLGWGGPIGEYIYIYTRTLVPGSYDLLSNGHKLCIGPGFRV